MLNIGNLAGKYHENTEGKTLSGDLFALFNDPQTVETIKKIYPSVAEVEKAGSAVNGATILAPFLDKEDLRPHNPPQIIDAMAAAAERRRENTDPNNISRVILAIAAHDRIKSKLVADGKSGELIKLQGLADDIVALHSKSGDCQLKSDMQTQIDNYTKDRGRS